MVERVGRSEVAHLVVYVAEAAEAHGVGVQHRLVFTFGGEDAVAVERLHGAPVEDEEEVAAAQGQYLVVVLLPKFLHRERLEVVLA